jgi:uncharacterized protein YaaN involved in tellurite resistance
VVRELEDASGSKEMEIVDSITTLGIQAQRHAGADLELLRARVGDLMTNEGPGSKVSKDLVDLRLTLNQINPHELSKPGFIGMVLRMVPLVGRLRLLLRTLEKVSVRYETVSRQVVIIETRLREGQMMLRRDNIELRKLYDQVEAQQVPIQRNAYLGELVMQQLDEIIRRAEDALKKDRVQNALYDVSMRVQDLRTMQEVHSQIFVSIEMTRQNNTRLAQSVDRTLTLATNLVMVGLAIQSALARQNRVLEATRRTREFLGNLLVANAAATKRHTTEIGDVYKNPVIALEKITQAHNDLIEAMDIADRLKTEGIQAAKENITKLSQLAAELEERAIGLREKREAQSFEARPGLTGR